MSGLSPIVQVGANSLKAAQEQVLKVCHVIDCKVLLSSFVQVKVYDSECR